MCKINCLVSEFFFFPARSLPQLKAQQSLLVPVIPPFTGFGFKFSNFESIFKIRLFKYNFHAVKLTNCKYILLISLDQWKQLYYHHCNWNTEHFHHYVKFPHAPFSISWLMVISFLSLTIVVPFLEFNRNGILQHVLLYVWLFSLMLYISIVGSFLLLSSIPLCKYTIICLSSHQLMNLVVPSFWPLKQICYKHSCTGLCVVICL